MNARTASLDTLAAGRSDALDDLGAAFASAAHDAIVCVNAKGAILYWNAAAESLFGYPASYAIGRSLDIIVPEAMRGDHAKGMRRIVDGGLPRLIGKPIEVPAERSDGVQFPIEMRISMWGEGEKATFGAVIRDVSERRKAEDRLDSLAHYDQLTMIPNRNLFLERLAEAIGDSEVSQPVALAVVEFDNFSAVHDTAYHAAGEDLLRATALALKRVLADLHFFPHSPAPTIARIGSEEFGVVIPGEGDVLAATVSADKILNAVRSAIAETVGTTITASLGVSICPEQAVTPSRLLSNADFALRRAKQDGGDRRQLFFPAHRRSAIARRGLQAELSQALASDEFEVFYQPQVRLSDRKIIGAEALIRWNHPDSGVVGPGAFLHAVKDGKLAEMVGDWVLETACHQAAAWRELTGRPFRIGVNLFERQLMREDMADRIQGMLDRSCLPADDLELEITENVMTGSDDASVRRVRRLRDLGVGISFDDYGTGYASLSLLKRYPITRLKIDRSFVRDLTAADEDAAIVELVVALGRRFGFGVIAEGVETREQEARLFALGCEEAQGYLFGRPMRATTFGTLLGQRIERRALIA